MAKVAKEQAEKEFLNFCDVMDIDTECTTKDEQEDFDHLRGQVIRAICSGALIFNDNSEPVFTPQRKFDGQPLTFREIDGAILMARDSAKGDVAAVFATLAAQSGTSAATFAKMKESDLKVCRALMRLFMA